MSFPNSIIPQQNVSEINNFLPRAMRSFLTFIQRQGTGESSQNPARWIPNLSYRQTWTRSAPQHICLPAQEQHFDGARYKMCIPLNWQIHLGQYAYFLKQQTAKWIQFLLGLNKLCHRCVFVFESLKLLILHEIMLYCRHGSPRWQNPTLFLR